MFESYNSPANQSAVDRLIQLATGKKPPAQEELESTPPKAPPVEAAAELSAAEQLFRLIDGHPAPEAAPATEPWTAEATPVAEEKVDERPFHEPSPEHYQQHDQEQQQDQHQNQENHYAQAAPAETHTEEHSPEAVTEPVHYEAAEVATPEAMHEPFFEAVQDQPVEAFQVQPVEPEPAAEYAFEHAVEPTPEPTPVPTPSPENEFLGLLAQAQSVPAPAVEEAATEAVDDRLFHEAPIESAPVESTPIESAPTETAEAETISEPVVEEASPAEEPLAAIATEAETATEEVPATKAEEIAAKAAEPADTAAPEETAASNTTDSASNSKDGDYKSFDLEQYPRLSANSQHAAAASHPDVVPSPGETTFLSSKGLSNEPTEEEIKELAQDPMWKTLMKFKGWLPMVSSMLPLLDLATGRNQSGVGVSEEMRDSMAGLMASQRDVRNALYGQTSELKRVEEEVAQLRDVSDKTAFEQATISEDMRSMQRLLKNAFLYVGILLGLLVVAVAYMAFLVFSYLNHPIH